MRIVVAGRLAGTPGQGGASWAVLQYALGLRRLGHDVWVVEPVDDLTPPRAAYFSRVVSAFGLDGRAALLGPDGASAGLTASEVRAAAEGADVLLNLSGALRDESLAARVPIRVYVDLDPAFTQLWHAVAGVDMGFGGHTRFVTVGLGVGAPGSGVPTCGIDWITMPPPVALDHWPVGGPILRGGLTSVGNWRSYGSIEHEGVLYGQRVHSVRALIDLPRRTDAEVTMAFSIHPDEERDLAALREHGWQLVDPETVAGTPAAYRAFVQGSWAELGIAKSGYVLSRSGWFSDRSACYLASGRPVLLQETGFSAFVPAGEGLLAYTTAEEAASAIEELRRDYPRHARAARAIAEDVLDSDKVLGRLLACL